jgi:hypothetical protein
MTRRTAHVDIDNVGACGLRNARAFRHPTDFAARELNDMRAYSGPLASQPRHRATVDKIAAGGHFRDHESGAQSRGQSPKRRVGNPRHRREQDPIGDLNITYFQWLKA